MYYLIGGLGCLLGTGLAVGLALIDCPPLLSALAAAGVWTAAGFTADLFRGRKM